MKKFLVVLVLFLVLTGCATTTSTAPAPNQEVVVKCNIPVITPMPETKELQKKSGIAISVALSPSECIESMMETNHEIEPTFSDKMALSLKGVTPSQEKYLKFVEVAQTPYYKVNPDRISFQVKINNQMQRVFRGDGTLVLYNFGGKNTSVSKEDYQEFTNLIVPPRTETNIVIYGPMYKDIPEKTTLGIFLYDVVTKTDNAGNVIEKQNFEWYYDYQIKVVKEKSGEIVKTKKWIRR